MIKKIERKNGFTLIELMVVIAFIGLISSVGIYLLDGSRKKSRDAARQYNLNQVRTAMGLYYSKYAVYPTAGTCGNAGVIAAAVNDPLCSGHRMIDSDNYEYFSKIPADPRNVFPLQYIYDDQSDESTYCIEVALESAPGDWFLCRDGACFQSPVDCDGNY